MRPPPEPPAPVPAPAAGGRLVLIAALAHLLLPWVTGHFPYQDITNHLARYTLLDRAWLGTPVPWIEARLVPTPYIAVDLLGVLLVHLLGPHLALRVLATLAIGILPLGMALLLRAVAPGAREWTLVAVLLSLSPFLLKGLINYQLGIGALLLWAAYWWPRRAHATGRARVALALGLGGLLLVHLAAGGVALLLLAADTLAGLQQQRGVPFGTRLAANAGRLATAFACGGVALLLLWWMARGAAAAPGGPAIVMRSVTGKLVALTEPFFTFTPWEMLLTGAGYLVALVCYRRSHRGGRTEPVFGLTTAALALLFLLTPASAGGAVHLDVRWLIPLLLLLFLTRLPAARPAPWVGMALCAACLGHAALIFAGARQIDAELDDFDQALRQLPAAARVLALVGGPARHGRVEPYLHYALWHTVDAGGRVGGLFSYQVRPAGEAPVVALQFAHFRERDPSVTLFDPWRSAGHPELPWALLGRQYDVVLQAGRDPELAALLRPRACPRFTRGAVTVWDLSPCS